VNRNHLLLVSCVIMFLFRGLYRLLFGWNDDDDDDHDDDDDIVDSRNRKR